MNETLTTVSGVSNYYSTINPIYSDTYSVSWDLTSLLSCEQKKELMTKLLESEDEFMPILKKYLVGYLDKILDNPEEIIKDLVKEKDSKIQELESKVSDLEKEIKDIKSLLPLSISPIMPITPSNDPLRTMPDITWGRGDVTSKSSTV